MEHQQRRPEGHPAGLRAYLDRACLSFCPEDLEGLRYRRLMVPLDGSQRAEYVLSLAASLAHSQDAQLLLAHVVKRPEIARRAPLTEEELELADRLVELNRAVAYRHGEAIYQIEVDDRAGVCRGIAEATVDGQALPDSGEQGIPLKDDGRTHEVHVVMGRRKKN